MPPNDPRVANGVAQTSAGGPQVAATTIPRLPAIYARHVPDLPIEIVWLPGGDVVTPLAVEPRLYRVLVHALRDLGEMLSASQAAEIAAVERKHFSKLFLRETGFHFAWWNREIRMRRAEELLVGHRLAIGSIALSVGYSNLTTFERSFKAWSGGVGPRAYLAAQRAAASRSAPQL